MTLDEFQAAYAALNAKWAATLDPTAEVTAQNSWGCLNRSGEGAPPVLIESRTRKVNHKSSGANPHSPSRAIS